MRQRKVAAGEQALGAREREIADIQAQLKDTRDRFDALRWEHAPCASTIKTRDEEVQRLRRANTEQEAALESLQQQLQSANAKADALREAHGPCRCCERDLLRQS